MKKVLKIFLASALCVCFFFSSTTFAASNSPEDTPGQTTRTFSAREIQAARNFFLQNIDPWQILRAGKITDAIENTFNRAVAALAFEVAFNSHNPIVNSFVTWDVRGTTPWYDSLENKQELNRTVYDAPTGKNINLHAKYIDNNSDITIIAQHGWHCSSGTLLGFAEFVTNELGYNIMIPDSRSRGKSGGQYMTFGAYESGDLTDWIDYEVQNRPNQKIALYGVSLGASIVLLSQQNPHPNVFAVIEDCGFATTEIQFRSVLQTIIDNVLPYIPWYRGLDWEGKKDQLLGVLDREFIRPLLKTDVLSISPLDSVAANTQAKLFIHGTGDTFISIDQMDMMYEMAQGYKQYLKIEGADHGGAMGKDPVLYKQTLIDFLKYVFPEQPPVEDDVDHNNDGDDIDFSLSGLTAKAAGKNKIQLTWEPTENAEFYQIYVYRNNNFFCLGDTDQTHFLDKEVSDIEYNYYWVFPYSMNEKGDYNFGKCDTYVYARGILPPVDGLMAVSEAGSSVKLSWLPGEAAEGYMIYAVRGEQDFQQIGWSDTTEFIDENAQVGNFNFYWVVSYYTSGEGVEIPGDFTEYVYAYCPGS